jgi:hypothetical protein
MRPFCNIFVPYGINDFMSCLNVRKLRELLMLSFAIMICTCSSAQILVGPTAGGQVGWVTFNNKDNRELYSSEPSFSYHAGASISFRMMKKFFLQGSILYSQKKKHLEGKEDLSFSNQAKYHYIDLPISFTKEVKMRFSKGKFYNLYFGMGPTISYWLGGKGTLTSSELNENGINPPDYDLDYKITFDNSEGEVPLGKMNVQNANRIQLGLNFTAGIVFEPNRSHKIMTTVRYELGHSYFSPDKSGDFGLDGVLFYKEDLQSRPQQIALSMFYFIDLKTEDRKRGKSTSKIRRN